MTRVAAIHDMSVPDLREREDRWEVAMAAEYAAVSVSAARDRPAPRSNYLLRQDLDDIGLVDMASSSCRAQRRGRVKACDTGDNVAMIFLRRGHELIEVDGGMVTLRPGDAALWDPSRDTFFEVRGAALKWNLLIPRPTFGEIADGPVAHGLVRRTPSLRVLSGLVAELSRSMADMTPHEVTSARNAVLDLLAGAISPRCAHSAGTTRVDLRARVDRWVQQHLDADLTPASAAAAHAVSSRTLSRLYSSAEESFGSYVRRQRLTRARQDLIQSDDTISAIAHRWRFADASHFTRRFIEQFGEVPSAVRRATRESASCCPAGPTVSSRR